MQHIIFAGSYPVPVSCIIQLNDLYLPFDQGLQVEVALVFEVGLCIAMGKSPVASCQGFSGHELHQALAEVSDQPLEEDRNDHAGIDGEVSTSVLATAVVEPVQGLRNGNQDVFTSQHR